MEIESIQQFALRPWDLVERLKADYWAQEGARSSPRDALCIGDALRRHAQSLRPDWPSVAERADDLRNHEVVARKLGLVRSHADR